MRLTDERGSASVEYVIVLVCVAVVLSLTILGLGAALVLRLDAQQAVLLSPTP